MIDLTHPYSLESFKSTFNIELGDFIPVTISFDPNRYLPSGSPGIVLKDYLLSAKKHQTIRVLFPFPTKKGIAPGAVVDINHENIHPLSPKSLITNHKIKAVDKFEKNKLYSINKYVADNAAITFTFSNLKAAALFWKDIPYLCSTYKYTALFYHLGGGRKRKNPEEKFIPFVSFIDLPYCIPVFDYRKIDGMGVCCGFMYKKGHEENGKILYTTTTVDMLYFILSNHQANILYTDGVKLGSSAPLGIDILNYMYHFIELEMAYKKQQKIPQKSDPPSILPSQGIISDVKVEAKENNYTNASYYTAYSTTSTSTWR